jgi:hypothetical protein
MIPVIQPKINPSRLIYQEWLDIVGASFPLDIPKDIKRGVNWPAK